MGCQNLEHIIEEAVEAAVGRKADIAIGKVGQSGDVTRCKSYRQFGEDRLLVNFGVDGRNVQVDIYRWHEAGHWERVQD